MRRVTPDRPWPLFDTAATRAIEQSAANQLPSHALMQRAGLATARLALAIAPHARTVWIACGPGNNGGDGLEAAVHLAGWGKTVHLTLAGNPDALPADAAQALSKARDGGLQLSGAPPAQWDLCIDALLGIGGSRPLDGSMLALADRMGASGSPVLAVDVPSGLNADTGSAAAVRATHTLSLLTLKPGLFTAGGRDAAGEIWLDELGVDAAGRVAAALLCGPPEAPLRPHASHKGSFGDVAVIGGATGMAGAAVLGASAALHAGAGRVFLCLLGDLPAWVPGAPELMVRDWRELPLHTVAVACGCGAGAEVASVLPLVLERALSLVLDADGLNAVANDSALADAVRCRRQKQQPTVLTPHPLEAARLLGMSTVEVQADRLRSAMLLAERFDCTVVLKGSGTVIAAPGEAPRINPTGNPRLATAGTGDVLAGMVAAGLAAGAAPLEAATAAVFRHGLLADHWPHDRPLTAAALARQGA